MRNCGLRIITLVGAVFFAPSAADTGAKWYFTDGRDGKRETGLSHELTFMMLSASTSAQRL